MTIKYVNGKPVQWDEKERDEAYTIAIAKNGMKFVTKETVSNDIIHLSMGNTKTGPAWNFNFSIEYTCDHRCECFLKRKCYAMQGAYNFADNQAQYTENYNFYVNSNNSKFIDTIQLVINTDPSIKLFRYFTCGDIPDMRFITCMAKLAENNPEIKFWAYTKKYSIVNHWIDENGSLPENLTIIFSHWMNEDGSYFPMDNPHKLPTSEYIPIGKEYLKENVTHICPCSNPESIEVCATCDHPCYTLKKGESMALLEHSTKETKERDKELKKAKAKLKEEKKSKDKETKKAKKAGKKSK